MKKCSTKANRFVLVYSTAILLLFAVGCEDAPPTNLPMMKASSRFVIENSDRKSDWEFIANEFAVAPSTSFRFVANANREKIKQSLDRIDAMPSFTVGQPDGIEDADYEWLSRFTEQTPELQWIAIQDDKRDVSRDAFCMAIDGRKLVTVGSEVVIWDSQNGKRLSNMPSVIPDCKNVFFDIAFESVYVANGIEIVKQKLTVGDIGGRWRPSKGPIIKVVKARDADVLAVVTQNGDVFALDSDLQSKAKLNLGSPFNPNIAISSDGRSIINTSRAGAVTWNIEFDSQTPVTSNMRGKLVESFERTLTASGKSTDHWIQGHYAYLLQEGKIPAGRERNPIYLLGYDVQFVHSATVDGTRDWLVTIGSRRNQAGKRVTQIQDLYLRKFESSTSQVLDRESILAASFDRTGERIAIRSEKGLEIVTRKRWCDSDGWRVAQKIIDLFRDGHLDRIERCAAELRKIGWRKNRWCGAEYWDDVAMAIATSWIELVVESAEVDLLNRIENWASQKSDLALMVSLIFSESINSRLDLKQFNGKELSQDQLMDLMKYKAKRNADYNNNAALQILLERGEPTPACFAMALHACGTEKLLTVGDRVLQTCVERWPTCSFPHRVALELLIKKNGIRTGECYAYISLLPQLLPSDHPYRNGMMASATCAAIDAPALCQDPPFSQSQRNAIVKNMFSDVPLHAWKFESWFPFDPIEGRDNLKLRRTELMRRLVVYHQSHYEIPGRRFYVLPEPFEMYSKLMDDMDP